MGQVARVVGYACTIDIERIHAAHEPGYRFACRTLLRIKNSLRPFCVCGSHTQTNNGIGWKNGALPRFERGNKLP